MIYTVVIIFIISFTLFAQNIQTPPILGNTASKIIQGFSESVEWYDVSFALLMVSKADLFVKDNQKIIRVAPFHFDEEIQEKVGISGRNSLGSMDQNKIPSIIVLTRTAFTIGKNMIAPESVSKDDFKKLFLFYKSMVYTHTLTELSKNLVARQRPDKSDSRSFFSGHSSSTFAAVSFLYREMGDYIDVHYSGTDNRSLNFWLKAASFSALYGWASYVAFSRMQDNKHYFSDVFLGAAAGTLISNLIYDSYIDTDSPSILNNFSLGLINNNPAFSFSIIF